MYKLFKEELSLTQLKELLEIDDLQEVWETSTEKPVILFKQSTTCPVSAEAFTELQRLLDSNNKDIAAYYVKVRETRPVSNQIAEDLGIQHQSPQAFVVKNKEAVWNASHNKITEESLTEALQNA